MNLEKAINHGVHGEHGAKTIDCMKFGIYPQCAELAEVLGGAINFSKLPFSVFSVPSVVIELRFLG
jgi:hypothetical protein